MAGWCLCPESPGFHPGLLGTLTGRIPLERRFLVVVLPLPSRCGLGRQPAHREHFVCSQWLDIGPRHGDHGDRITERIEDFQNATLAAAAWMRNEVNDVGDVTGTQVQFLEIPAQCHSIVKCHSHDFLLRRGLSVTK